MAERPTQPLFDVLTFGDLCVDLIMTGQDVSPEFGQVEKLVDDYTLEMGGSSCIFACQAAKLGLRTAVVGRVGNDSFGQLILNRLHEFGVDTRYITIDPTLKTGIGIALCPPGDRAILTYIGTINAIRPEYVTDEILSSARHLHHGSYYLQTNLRPAMPAIFERAHRLGMTTSLDTNWDPEECWDGSLSELLAHTDVFMPNDQEALNIYQALSKSIGEGNEAATVAEASAAAYFLQHGSQVVTIKAGARGAQVYTPEGRYERGVQPVSGGDSIGAGDSFDAGFLSGWLRGYSLKNSLEIAVRCGRSVASQVGGLAGQLSWDDIESQA